MCSGLLRQQNAKISTSLKLFISIMLITIALSGVVVYWQNAELENLYKNEINKELGVAKHQWEKSFAAYNSMLRIIEKNIISNEISTNNKAVSSIIKQFYLNSKDAANNTPIDFSDIAWKREESSYLVNRYGVIPSDKLPIGLENAIRTTPETLYLYNIDAVNNIIVSNGLFLTRGLIDKHKNYIGNLSIKLDLDPWIKNLSFKLQDYGYLFAITDHDKKVLFSSNKVGLQKDFVLTTPINLEPYPYMIVMGYSKSIFNKQLIKNIWPLISIIWCVGAIYLILQLIYSTKLKNEIRKGFIAHVDTLTKSNAEYLQENVKITSELNQQINDYNNMIRQQNSLIKAFEMGIREKHKLESMLGNRIAEALAGIREITRILADGQNGSLNIAINKERQIELLADINDKLAYLSMFCVAYKTDEQIELREIIDDTVKIYAREILESTLNIKIKVQNKIKKLHFDELLLRQLLANLLRASISGARPNGEITISATIKKFKNKDILIIIIKDDGFGIPGEHVGNFEQSNELYYPTSPLSLDLSSIQGIAESFNGNLVTEYMIGVGKIITLNIPCEFHKHTDQISIDGENIVMFKKD
jgi:signal transduction histidine kinase